MDYLNKTKEELISELIDQKQELDSFKLLFDKGITDRNQIEYFLKERLKELSCHDQITEVMSNSELSIDEVCEKIVQILPASWQFPEIAEASIQIPNHVFSTSGYKPGKYSMVEDIKINQVIWGQIEVCYPDDQIPATDQLFLPEESSLLFSIAVKLGNYIEKKEKGLALEISEEKYKDLIENITDVIYTTDNQGNITFISPSITRLLGYSPEDIIGRNFSNFTGETTEHLKKRFEEIKDKSELQSEYQILSVTGEPHWMRFSSKALIKEGQFVGVTGTIIDITERRQIELKLQKSEETYRNLVESINDIVFEVTIDGTIKYLSPSIERLFQLNAESLIGQSFFVFVHPEDISFLLDIFRNNRFSDHKKIEYRCLTETGETIWVQASARNVYEEDRLVGRTGILRDITEQKLAEEKLRKSEEQYRKLVESVKDVLFDIDATGNIRFISQSVLNVLGYTVEEAIGQNIFSFLYPEDVPVLVNAFKNLGTRDYSFMEYRYVRKDGSIRWVRSSTTPQIEDGEMIGATGTMTDVTERRVAEEKLSKSEEQYRKLVESVNDVIYEIDVAGNIRFVSHSVINILGYTVEEVTGRNIFSFIYSEDVPVIMNSFKNLSAKDYSFMEYRYVHKDGSVRWVRSSTTPQLKNGEMIGATGTLTDVTERRVAEGMLKDKTNVLTNLIINLQEGILLEDSNRNIALTNQLFCSMFGIPAPPEALIGADCSSSAEESKIFFRNPEKFITDIERILENKKAVFNDELELKDGRYLERDYIPTYIEDKYNGHLWKYRDITGRKLAEAKVRESEEKFRLVFENVFDGISIFEEATEPQNRKLIECNEQFALMAGRSRDELLELGNTYSLTKTHEEGADSARIKGISEQKAFHGSFSWIRPDGIDNTIEYIARPITWQGKSYSIGIDRDITEYKQKEDKLRKLSQAVEQSPVSIVITDLDGNIEYANPKATETTGYSLDELKGKNPRVLKSGETPQNEYEFLWDSISNGNIWRGIFHNKRKNGELYWESSQITPINNANGKIINYLAIKEDITERKQIQEELAKSEDRFRQIVEQSQTVIWEVDPKGLYTYVSPLAETVWGYTPDEIIGKKHFYDLHPAEGRVAFKKAALEAIHRQEKFSNFQNKVVTGDDRTIWVSTNGIPVLDNQNNLIGYRGADNDITSRLEAVEELRQSEERYKSIFRNNHSVMMIIDPDTGDIIDVNSSACEYYKWSHEELCCKNISDINALTRKETKEELRNAKGEKRNHFFFKHRLGTGELRDVEVYSSPIRFGNSTLLYSIVHDITDRRVAEDALIQREKDLNFSQEIAGMGSWQINMATNTSKWSNNLYRIFGLDPDKEKASQDLFFELIHPDDRHLIGEYMEKILRDRKQVTFEMRINLKSGKTIWIQNSMIPGFEGEQLVTLNGTNVDITSKKLSEEALRINEAALNQAQEISMMCSWELDLITGKITWSKNYYHLMGIPVGKEMKTEFFQERVHPEDLHLVAEKLEEMKALKKSVIYDIRLLMPENEYRWIQNNIVPEFENGKLIRFKGVNIDITEKKLAEEYIKNQNDTLKAILTAIPDLMFVIDKDGKYLEVFANENEKLLLSPDKIVGSNIEQAFSREMTDLLMVKIRASIQKRMVETIDYVISLDNSPSTDFEARIVPIDQNKVLILARDVTEKSIREKELKRLSMAVQQSPVIIVITNLSGDIEYVNPAFHEITGYEPDEVLGKNTRILKSGETDPKVYVNLWETITAGDNWNGEWINKKKNGELYWENVSITPIRDDNGKVTNYMAIKQDISQRKQTEEELNNLTANLEVSIVERTSELTLANYRLKDEIEERKRIENALSESEKSYRTVVENVNEVIFQTDAEGMWLFLNKSWEDVTGFTVEESIGQRYTNFVHPDDIARNRELIEPLINRKKDHYRHEIRYLTKDGGLRWIEVFARLALTDNDEIAGTYGTLQDITDRRQAETALALEKQRLANIIRGTNTGTWEWNIQTGETVFNERWAEMLGYTIEELSPVSIETWLKLAHPDDLKISGELLEKHFKGESDYYSFESRMRHKTGDWVWVLDRGQVHNWDQDGKPLTMSGTHQDITERKLAEDSLRQQSARLALALRAGSFGVWDYDIVNNSLLWDNQMFAIYGAREEDFSNAYDAWLKGLHPDDRIRGDEEIQMAIRGEKEFDTEFRVVWPDGSVRYVRALGTVERDNSGRAHRVIGTNWDITNIKRAADFENEMLQLSPQLTGIAFSKINDAINQAISRIGQFLSADRAYVFELNASGSTMNNSHEWCNAGINPEIENLQDIPCDVFPHWMEALHRHENIVIPSVPDLPESWHGLREALEPQGIQSLIAMPLITDGILIGFVGLDSVVKKKEYTNPEINILKVWSSMLASLINNQRSGKLLEQTRQNYETFFNTIDDFLFIFEENGNIVDINKTVTDRLGYQTEEIMNQSVLFVRPVNRHAEALKVMKDILNNTISYCTVPLLTKSGEQIPVETRIKRGFWNGRPVIFGVSKDISQIKISEQKFASAFHSNSAVMTITRFDNDQFVDVNNAFVSLLGYSHEEIRGETLLTLGIVKEVGEGNKIQTFIEEGIPVKEIEINAYSKSNELFIFLMSAEEIFVGLERCILSVAVNITERKIMENELRKAREEADQANLAKSEFLSRMSHELRTPMNSILGFAQLLEMGELNARQSKGVNHIMKSGKHLLDLINEVLDISRIEAGRLSLSLEPVQLSGVISEMIDIVKLQANEHQIKLELTNSLSNQLFVKADRQRLKQIILNLLNNSIKYNRDNGTVTIQTELKPANSLSLTMVRISITDTGWGISEKDLPKLFRPFERIGAEKTGTEGTGLGLSVVKKLVEAMSGNLGVESMPEVGSTFWIEFPYSESQLENVKKSGGLDSDESKLAKKSGSILYIEDNLSNIELVEQILINQRPELKLITNENGNHAVQLASDNQPDLILLDLDLPDIHGHEVLKRLQTEAKTREIPVIIISADAMPQQIEKLLKAGARNYLTKPLAVIDFLKVIDEFIVG